MEDFRRMEWRIPPGEGSRGFRRMAWGISGEWSGGFQLSGVEDSRRMAWTRSRCWSVWINLVDGRRCFLGSSHLCQNIQNSADSAEFAIL